MTTTKTKLDRDFQEAVKQASQTDIEFPPDIRLNFYAYYKRAMGSHSHHGVHKNMNGSALISAFKMNALFQAKNLTPEEAKRKYIELVQKHIRESSIKK